MGLRSDIKNGSDSLTTDTRLLVGSGILLALVATLVAGRTEKGFTLLSTTSSGLVGGGLGIIRERSKVLKDEEEERAINYGAKLATPPIGSVETYEDEY